jgi:hypothetical protein
MRGLHSVDGFIPMENGAIAMVSLSEMVDQPPRLSVEIDARICAWHGPDHDPLWLPINLRIVDGELRTGWQSWDGCEEWWVAEHLDRVSAMPVAGWTQSTGRPNVELVPWGSLSRNEAAA